MLKFNKHIGLDIGSRSIKVVQLSTGSKGRYLLSAYGQTPYSLPEDPVEAEKEKIEMIKRLIIDAKITSKQVAVSLPESSVFTRVVEMPFLEEPELVQALQWQAEQYIPVPIADVVLKHQVLTNIQPSGTKKILKVLLVAAPTSLLNSYVNMLSSAGLDTIAIDTEVLALARALVGIEPNSPTTLLVNIGMESTTLSVINQGDLVLTQSISTGGVAITRAIMSSLGLDNVQADEYKMTYGLDETKLEGKVLLAVRPIVDIVVAELKRVLSFYSTHGGTDPVKRVVLSGGTALMPGLIAYLTQNLDIEAQIGNPFSVVDLTEKQKEGIGENFAFYSNAVGLALKPT